MLRQFSNVWRKRKQATSATTINNKMNGQLLVEHGTWYWYQPSWVALWAPRHQGPLSIISHSIFKPTSSQPKGPHQRAQSFGKYQSWVAPEGPEQKSISEKGGFGSTPSLPIAPTGAGLPVPITCSMASWSLPLINCWGRWWSDYWPAAKKASLGSTLTNVRTVQLLSLPCKKADLQINSQGKLRFTSMAKAELQHGQILQGPR